MLRLARTVADSSPTALRLARSVALPRRSLCGRSTALHRILSCRPPPQSFAALLLLHGGTPAFAVQRRVAARQAAIVPEAESASLSLDGRPRSALGALRLLARAFALGLLLLRPLLLLLPALLLRGRAWQSRFERALVHALERGGPCLTKLGQWASTRPDVLPASLCATLGELHSRAGARV